MDSEEFETIIKSSSRAHNRMMRSTYNSKTARRMQPYFDQAIKTKKHVLIERSMFNMNKHATLYKKIKDALQWLMDHDKEPAGYIRLHTYHRTDCVTEGILVTPLFPDVRTYNEEDSGTADIQPDPDADAAQWREDFEVFMQDPDRKDIKMRGKYTVEDIDWVNSIAEQLEYQCRATKHEIVVIK